MINTPLSSYKMKNRLLSLSRNLFKAVNLFDSLLSQTFVILTELREIRNLLTEQREQDQTLRLIPARQAADGLKVHTQTLLRWARQGKLTLVQIGRQHYYKASEVL